MIQPYRKEAFKKEISLKLPEDIQTGMNNIVISGGFTGETYRPQYNEEDYLNPNDEVKENTIQGYQNFDEIIKDYLSTPKNNEIIVQVYPGYNPPSPSEEGNEDIYEEGNNVENPDIEENIEKENEEEKNENIETEAEIKELFKTDFVLEGSLNLNVEVETKNNKEENIENKEENKSKNDDGLED